MGQLTNCVTLYHKMLKLNPTIESCLEESMLQFRKLNKNIKSATFHFKIPQDIKTAGDMSLINSKF